MKPQGYLTFKMARAGYARFYGDTMRDGMMEWDYLPSNSIEKALWIEVAEEILKVVKENYDQPQIK